MIWVFMGYFIALFRKIKNKCMAMYNTYVLFGGITQKSTGGGALLFSSYLLVRVRILMVVIYLLIVQIS